ncbi:hypothetical protein [Pseudomonas lini]
MNLQVFIDAPYDHFVTTDTRFWNASGVDFSLGAEGAESQNPVDDCHRGWRHCVFFAGGQSRAEPATAHSPYSLAQDQKSGMTQPDGPAHYIQRRFDQSLRG